MFTGIIQNLGRVARTRPLATEQGRALELEIDTGFGPLTLGESIAVNGACLTVIESAGRQSGRALFFLSSETLAKTSLHRLMEGDPVNLERALTAGASLSGHWVQGHVDGVGRITRLSQGAGGTELELALPASFIRYCVEKGSIAVDGVSLTLNWIRPPASPDSETAVGIMLIPHTWDHTAFHRARVNDPVNIEVDILAKYVEAQLHWATQSNEAQLGWATCSKEAQPGFASNAQPSEAKCQP